MNFISKIKQGVLQIAAVAVVVGATVAMPQTASANTGAGALILNVVTVNYKDASGATAYAETATSSVTVNLVISAPTLTAPADQAVASGSTATYTYTITATANGSDTYPITTPIAGQTNVTGQTATPSVANITLGASVITAAPTASTITIPSGSDTNLAVNDIVVIGGADYAISAISANNQASHVNASGTDGVAGTTTAEVPVTLTLIANAAGSNTAPAFAAALVGTVVGEQGTFTVAVTATAGPAAGDGTVPVTTTVTTSGGTPLTTTDPIVTTFQGAQLTIVKEVSVDGGATFAASGSGAPGDTLTYRITINNAGSGNATVVTVTDPMPLYTTYTAGTAKSNTAATTYANAANTGLTDIADGDAYNFTGTTATLNVGTLAAGATSVLLYQVKID
ncbi:MAG: hypothetical protein Q9N67_05400 [Ghiorsea sp.]|nr:hypothetical protein [Ghiorsea sp.]